MAYPQTYVDILNRLARRGCAVCGLLLRDEHDYLESLLYEYVNDAGVQQAFRQGRGLCNHHSWLLTHQHGYSLGVAILFEAALDEVIHVIDSVDPTSQFPTLESAVGGLLGRKGDTKLAASLEPEIPCLACANLCKAETRYLDTFATYWSDPALQSAYQHSNGLCLPHFRHVLRQIPEPQERARLVALQRAKWETLRGELDQFQVKSAFNYVGEAIGAEADAWRRAVECLTGGEHAVLTLTRPV